MSYFNDFAAGYQMTSGKRERDRDRADKLDQEKLRQDFEIDRDTARYKAEQDRQGERISADAKKQFNQNFFSAGEADAGRRYGTTEREAGQTYQSGEGEKGRTFTGAQNDADRALRADKNKQDDKHFNDRINFDLQNMGLMAGFKSREQEARADPANPANQLQAEKLAKIKRENALGADVTPVTPPPAAPPILTPEEAKKAKPGTRYRTQDGRQMTR